MRGSNRPVFRAAVALILVTGLFIVASVVVSCAPETQMQTVVVDREVVVEVEKVVTSEVPVEIPVTVEVTREVVVEIEKPVPVEVVVEVEKPVLVETLKEVVVEVEIERVVTREVEKIVEVFVERDSAAKTAVPETTSVVTNETQVAEPVKATSIPTASATPLHTPTPVVPSRIEFTGISSFAGQPSRIEVIFSLRSEDGRALALSAAEAESELRVYERNLQIGGWEEIDYAETGFSIQRAESVDAEVVFVLDFTNSIKEARLADGRTGIDAVLEAFDAALSELPSAHRAGVVEFHDRNVEPSILSKLTTDREALRASVVRFASSGFDSGSSRVWDAVDVGTLLYSGLESNPRTIRALIFLSDGRDTSSRVTREALIRIAEERQVQFYALGLGENDGTENLRDLAAKTGGAYYSAVEITDVKIQLTDLVEDFLNQYRLTYLTERQDGNYETGVSFSRGDLFADMQWGPFSAEHMLSDYTGGTISHDPPTYDPSSGTSTVYVRAHYLPAGIDRIRFDPGFAYGISVDLVPPSDGGLLEDWNLSGPDETGFYEIRGTTPIKRGTSGPLFKMVYNDVWERGTKVDLIFDEAIYVDHWVSWNNRSIYLREPERIAFIAERGTGQYGITFINLDGEELKQVQDRPWDYDPTYHPTLSPDGNRVVFASFRDGSDLELYAMKLDGTGFVRLTDNSDRELNPAWSPDGLRIAYQLEGYGLPWNIYVMNADGSGVVRLTDNESFDTFPAWSPDSDRLAFVSDRDAEPIYNIYVMNADGSDVVRLTEQGSYYYSDPDWSPDGEKLVYVDHSEEGSKLLLMNSDGSDVQQIHQSPEWIGGTVWSLDGTRIAFTTDQGDSNALWVINADGTGLETLLDLEFIIRDPVWVP